MSSRQAMSTSDASAMKRTDSVGCLEAMSLVRISGRDPQSRTVRFDTVPFSGTVPPQYRASGSIKGAIAERWSIVDDSIELIGGSPRPFVIHIPAPAACTLPR